MFGKNSILQFLDFEEEIFSSLFVLTIKITDPKVTPKIINNIIYIYFKVNKIINIELKCVGSRPCCFFVSEKY